MFAKVEVNGPNSHPLYVELKKRASGLFGRVIKWNFTKFLIEPSDGRVRRFAPTPQALRGPIEQLLAKG